LFGGVQEGENTAREKRIRGGGGPGGGAGKGGRYAGVRFGETVKKTRKGPTGASKKKHLKRGKRTLGSKKIRQGRGRQRHEGNRGGTGPKRGSV